MKKPKLISGLFTIILFLGVPGRFFAEDAEVKLNSNDGSTKMIVQDKDAKTVSSFDSAGNLVVSGTATVAGSKFSVGGATLVVASGNVGIGTTNPGAKLDVNGSAKISRYLTQAADTGITLSTADFGATITVNSGATQTVALPAVTASDLGAQFTIVKQGVGTVIVQAAGGTSIADSTSGGTIYNNSATETYATITLRLTSSTMWSILGGNGSWTTN